MNIGHMTGNGKTIFATDHFCGRGNGVGWPIRSWRTRYAAFRPRQIWIMLARRHDKCDQEVGGPANHRSRSQQRPQNRDHPHAETAMLRDTSGNGGGRPSTSRNVLGDRLEICSINPMTGFFRDGCCDTGREDIGSHTVCAVMSAAFLEFSKSRGNDLSTPMPEFGFRGLKPGDRWCLCAPRWQEALEAGQAPRVVLRATHEGALGPVDI
jgi:uncharacterized protein